MDQHLKYLDWNRGRQELCLSSDLVTVIITLLYVSVTKYLSIYLCLWIQDPQNYMLVNKMLWLRQIPHI